MSGKKRGEDDGEENKMDFGFESEPTEGDRGSAEKGGDRPWWQEAMRDLTSTGVASFLLNEEGIRRVIKEKKLPKELAGLFLDGLTRRKDDLYGVLAKEFGKMLGKIDLSREMERFLERHHVRLEAKLSFERKGGEGKEPAAAPSPASADAKPDEEPS